MLASQRTRLLQRGHAELIKFDPAEILLAGAAAPISCVTGAFRQLGQALNPGGFLPDLQIGFRVTRTALASAAITPVLGAELQWRLPGETPYRGTVKIESIIDRPSVPYVVLGCGNRNK